MPYQASIDGSARLPGEGYTRPESGAAELRGGEPAIISNAQECEAPAPREWVERYLALLGVEHPAPSPEALTRLTRAHVGAVLFENVTSILRRQAHPTGPVPPVDPEAVLVGWERGRGGGVCFELVELFGRLLIGLGYRARPVLGDMKFPGAHQALLVELDGRRYLADVGNGAPFFEPIPLDGETEVRRAGLAYRFRPDGAGEGWVQDRLIAGVWEPFCRYDLRPPDLSKRAAAYQRHHTPGESWVVGDLTLIRLRQDEVWTLRNGQLSRFTADGKWSEPVEASACARLAAEVFGMPGLPVEEALRALAGGASAPTA